MGVNIDDRSLMNVNILKFFEKSFCSSGLSRIFEMSKGNNHLKIKDMKEKLLEAMNAEIFEAHLLLDYTGCTDLIEFFEAMLSLEREKKIRRSEVTGYYEII